MMVLIVDRGELSLLNLSLLKDEVSKNNTTFIDIEPKKITNERIKVAFYY